MGQSYDSVRTDTVTSATELDTRTMTPDAMNLDYNALLASRDYLSTQSEGKLSGMHTKI